MIEMPEAFHAATDDLPAARRRDALSSDGGLARGRSQRPKVLR